MAHWSEAYIGLPYITGEQDCAELLARVQREVFGRQVTVPRERADSPFGKSVQISQGARDLADPVPIPVEGDAVLMMVRGLWHVGVWFEVGEPWVLHALRSAGEVVSHRMRELPAFGIKVEGFYRMRGDE
jgi:hypothetical protein